MIKDFSSAFHIYRISNMYMNYHFLWSNLKKSARRMLLVLKSPHVWHIKRCYDSFICFLHWMLEIFHSVRFRQVELKSKITLECYYKNRFTLPIHPKDHRDLPVILRSNMENNFEQCHICLPLSSSGYIFLSSHIEIPTVCFTKTQ